MLTSEPLLGQHQCTFNGAKKIHLVSEKLILAVAKERFERTITAVGSNFEKIGLCSWPRGRVAARGLRWPLARAPWLCSPRHQGWEPAMLRRALARLDAAGLRGWRRGVLEPFAAEEHTHRVRGVELVLATRQNARLAMMETGDTTGAAIWGSALLLSRVLEAREAQSPELRGASVLELGSGTGLVGLACAALGARDVTLTDRAALHSHCSHGADGELHVAPPVRDRFTLDLLAANVAANAAVLPDCTLAVRELEWGDNEHLAAARAAAPPGGHDVIVGSDLACKIAILSRFACCLSR
eukprot:COSAG04_NODE_738_length_10699_cov_72.861604_11_plen_298_part_00